MRLLCGNPQIGEKTTGPLGYQNVYYNSVYKWVQPPQISLEEYTNVKPTPLATIFIQQDGTKTRRARYTKSQNLTQRTRNHGPTVGYEFFDSRNNPFKISTQSEFVQPFIRGVRILVPQHLGDFFYHFFSSLFFTFVVSLFLPSKDTFLPLKYKSLSRYDFL